MTLNQFQSEILRRSLVCGGKCPKQYSDARTKDVLAAAAVLIKQHGPEYCINNQKWFVDNVLKSLGFWTGLAKVLLALTGVGSIYLAIATWVIPIVIDWLREKMLDTAFSSVNWSEFVPDAETHLKGLKK